LTASQIIARRRLRGFRRRPNHAPKRGMTLLVALIAVGGVLLGIAGGGAIYAQSRYDDYAADVVPPEELLAELSRGGARILDRNGVQLYEFVDEFGGLRRPVALADISPWLVAATVATEDATFWTNNGINTRGLLRAAFENFSPFGDDDFLEGSGGSSITQQLAKNVYIPAAERTERSVDRKLRETVIAVELTEQYSKEQILEWYLNSISYGGIYVGIETAAQGYFGKAASELTLAESSLLAGVPQSPTLYNPLENPAGSKERQREVLELMVRHGAITQEQADRAFNEPIVFAQNRFEIEAPHFVLNNVAKEIEARFGPRALYEDGLTVTTTLDIDLQHEAARILDGWISEFEVQSDGHNGALYALDPNTGEVLVYLGSRDYFNDDIQGRNNNITGLNSPGSTLKPFTFMTAFMRGWSTGTGIIDAPASIIDPSTGAAFQPRNPSGNYQGLITAANALGNSLNVTAFKAILFAGVENTRRVMQQVGMTTLHNPGGYGPSLTLGGVDITLEDVTYSYATLANNGMMKGQETLYDREPGDRTLDPVSILKVTDSLGKTLYEYTSPVEKQVVGANFAYLVTSILSDPSTQCITFSCGALGLTGRPSAQKTGTSEPYIDSRAIGDTWTFGYTPDLVAGVWAGNSDNSPMVNIVSTSISWRSWRDFMDYAHTHLQLEPKQFTRPDGVASVELCWPSGRLPSEHCPEERRYEGLIASDLLGGSEEQQAALQDTWWQEIAIDSRTGLPADASTPEEFVSREVRLVLPEEETKGWDGLMAWAAGAGVLDRLGPVKGVDAVSGDVQITAPSANQRVSGELQITGRANTPGLRTYSIEWGRGTDPASWVTVMTSNRRIAGGVLGTWNTLLAPDGDYTLRVRVDDEQFGTLRYAIPLTVDNGGAGAATDVAPGVEILQPAAGGVVSGILDITGTAAATNISSIVVEVGASGAPAEWTRLATHSENVVNGRFAGWDTTSVPNGLYTIRVVVTDAVLGSAEQTVLITVKN